MATAMKAARVVGMALVVGTATVGAAIAQSSGSQARTVEGTWYIQVTPIDCINGEPVPNVPPVNALQTFHPGGTISETAAGFAPGQRSPGHGMWRHDAGQTFSQKFTALINFSAAGGAFPQAGWQVVEHAVELSDRDTFSSKGTNAFYKTDGTLQRSGCSTAMGRRFQ